MTILLIALCWMWVIIVSVIEADHKVLAKLHKKPITVGNLVKVVFFLPLYLILSFVWVCEKASNIIGPIASKVWNFEIWK